MLTTILAWALSLAPAEPHARLETVSAAIAHAVEGDPDARRMAAVLTAISLAETRFGYSGVPFGACGHLCRTHCHTCHPVSLPDVAAWSAGVIRRGLAICGGNLGCAMVFYHLGTTRHWRDDHFAAMETRIIRRLIAAH